MPITVVIGKIEAQAGSLWSIYSTLHSLPTQGIQATQRGVGPMRKDETDDQPESIPKRKRSQQ
ncbi:hypothetical protein CH63R_00027 [Colletotrichum higginsianum IMI 349063]|uniref:Uncharacterized protein n=1 Tax=Colletotrichum higginsianum (strain IMI 349063) TaxID=759273 RepID=A0A1B7YS34_COLHI|nr:hypothetical protein CH63R_00027 [Colletotrichum higginsianum IMI 349063]OBR14847.1 hypothetical protein CH63R_00027 [Colletotrichum higginsianum IMI 349063]